METDAVYYGARTFADARWGRRMGATLGGSPTPDARLKDGDRKARGLAQDGGDLLAAVSLLL